MSHPLHLFQYCPRCGAQAFVPFGMKAKRCSACSFVYFLNPSAATVALIERQVEANHADGQTTRTEWLCVRRSREPALGTLDLPGGFSDIGETSEQGVAREVLEETGLSVVATRFLFSLPNLYQYSGFTVPTIDMFYRCQVADVTVARAADDAAELLWLSPDEINPADFGLTSIRQGVTRLLAEWQASKRNS